MVDQNGLKRADLVIIEESASCLGCDSGVALNIRPLKGVFISSAGSREKRRIVSAAEMPRFFALEG